MLGELCAQFTADVAGRFVTWDKRGSIRGQRHSMLRTILGPPVRGAGLSPSGPHPVPVPPLGGEVVAVDAWEAVEVVVDEVGKATGLGFWRTA